MLGWGEFELEVMRDHADNVVIVCSIENVDPMGVHTGDSVDGRAAADASPTASTSSCATRRSTVIRAVGVETGGSNVQFAVNPETGEIVVIEMNPRVSRSSALASKATGFPIAKIAARLAVGYTLEEIPNDITGATPASFEPAIDYVVVKWPRFAFEKFPGAERRADHAHEARRRGDGDRADVRAGVPEGDALARARRPARARPAGSTRSCSNASRTPGPTAMTSCSRRCAAARASRSCTSAPRSTRGSCASSQALATDPRGAVRRRAHIQVGRHLRRRVRGAARPTTTPAGSAPAPTARRARGRPRASASSVVILGSGPNRIGQGIEFDYCCVHAAQTRARGRARRGDDQLQPGDGLDRLRHLRPPVLRAADARGRARGDRARAARGRDRPVRRPDAAAARRRPRARPACRCSDERRRDRRGRGPRALRRAARRGSATRRRRTRRRARSRRRSARAERVGFPLLVRPSYVLGGRAMEIVYSPRGSPTTSRRARRGDDGREIYLDRFLENAIEVDVDALCDGEDGLGRRDHAARRGGRRSTPATRPACCRRTRSARRCSSEIRDADARHRAGARRRRPAQRPVRGRRTTGRAVRDRGQPARLAHRAVRLQGDRRAAREARLPGDARRALAELGLPRGRRCAARHVCVKEAVLPFDRFAGADSLLGPGDALDRRGDGHRDATSRPRSRRRRRGRASALPARGHRRSSRSPTPTSRRRAGLAAQPARPRLRDRRDRAAPRRRSSGWGSR